MIFNYRIWLALVLSLALCASHWKAYTTGAARVTSAWDAERLEQAQALLKQSEANRTKEQALVKTVEKVRHDYSKLKAARAVDAARATDSLRDLQAELAKPGTCGSASAAAGTYGPGGLERELLNHCATALAGLATEADRLENKVVGLQGYIKATQ